MRQLDLYRNSPVLILHRTGQLHHRDDQLTTNIGPTGAASAHPKVEKDPRLSGPFLGRRENHAGRHARRYKANKKVR